MARPAVAGGHTGTSRIATPEPLPAGLSQHLIEPDNHAPASRAAARNVVRNSPRAMPQDRRFRISYPHRYGRTLLFPVAAAALIACGQAAAQPTDPDTGTEAASPAAAHSPFFGEWELDLNRMPETYGPPPKRVTFTFEDAGSGMWRTKVEITAPDGSVRRAAVKYRRDGRAGVGVVRR